MAMAALSCSTPLAGRLASSCVGFFRAALHSSPAAAARFSVANSSECGLRSFGSRRVRDDERLTGAGAGAGAENGVAKV